MKATIVFLTFVGALAVGSVVPPNQQQQPKVADNEWLQRQYNILKLFVNVHQPNQDQEQAQTGNSFDMRNQIDNFSNTQAVKQLINAHNNQQLLQRGEVFNVHNPQHLQQAINLFDVLYFANNYNTFYQAACWAKQRINEGQYIYALAVAVYNRPDTQGMQIPPMSEVHPHLYVDYQAIRQAYHLKQKGQQNANILANCTGQYPNWDNDNQQEQPQRSKPQPYQPDQPDQPNQPDQPGQQTNYPYPYHSDQQQQEYHQQYNPESIVSYYNEDSGMNQLYADLHLQQPFWLNTQKYQNIRQQNQGYGENTYYLYQQAVARYNLERLTNGLPPVTPISYNQPIHHGYCPNVQYANGQQIPTRPDNVVLQQDANQYVLQKVQDYERRIRDAIDSQFAYTPEGAKVKLTADNGVEILSQMMQTNPNALNNNNNNNNNNYEYSNTNDVRGTSWNLYGYIQMMKKLVGHIVDPYNQNGAAPGAVENYNAALNDPVMYKILARAVMLIQQFKQQLQPYKQDQVYYQGVKVSSVQTDKLVTYFDTCNVNLYNALSYQQGQQAQSYDYKANQQCLNNKPFTYRINVQSDKSEDAIVRVFIGPKYNAQGQPMSLQQAKNHYVEIDRFVTTLKNGQNTIERNSKQSNVFVDDQQQSTRNLMRNVQQAQQGSQPYYYYDNQNAQTGFPERMMLPKGTQDGQQMVMFVIVNKYEQSTKQNQNQALNIYQVQDNRAQGYPLDRQINENMYSHCPNCYYKEVTIYYKPQNQINSAA